MNEATARIKINRLLELSGWRFLDDEDGSANIRLEPSVAIKTADLDELGSDFEKTEKGFIDLLLLDERGRPLVVLEAKSERNDPIVGKEQALVNANRELVERMEAKIQAAIGRVWETSQQT